MGIAPEVVDKWLEYIKGQEWHFSSGGMVTTANFRTSLMRFAAKEKRGEAASRRFALKWDDGTKRQDAASPSYERKKPSWMTWAEWQFEETERRNNARLMEKVERVNKGLDEIMEEYGI